MEHLDNNWHIFVQPKLSNLQPDFLLFARHCKGEGECFGKGHKMTGPRHLGVTIIEVKDWSPSSYRSCGGDLQVFQDGRWNRPGHDPLEQVHEYRKLIWDYYLPPPWVSPEDRDSFFAGIRGVVFMPKFMLDEAKSLLSETTKLDDYNAGYIGVAGKEVLSGGKSVDHLVQGSNYPFSRGFGEDHGRVIDRFWHRIAEPEVISDQRLRISLSSRAKEIAYNPRSRRTRRMKGAAGSGKTCALAVRAAKLGAEGGRVLILTFNITLSHYVQDLVKREARFLGKDRACHNVDVIHFHGFLKWAKNPEIHSGRFDSVEDFEEAMMGNLDFWRKFSPYDAILVDEGQDFTLPWWNFLRHNVLKEDGEMLLTVDNTQDIYERRSWVDEGKVSDAGFSGRWIKLEGSYRLPSDMIDVVRKFGENYLGAQSELPSQLDLLAGVSTVRRWLNIPSAGGVELAKEVEDLLEIPGVKIGDVYFLASHKCGEEAEKILSARMPVESIFSQREKEQHRKKEAFWAGVNTIKGSTIHSFKGWEGKHIVVLMTMENCFKADASDAAPLLYIAMSRVKGVPGKSPSHLTVINGISNFNDFKDIFEHHANDS